ncbi:ER membrane complex subunit 7 [Labeo rohita]|uniref:Endoplasmic reticulum membrane protein complex subunit 7 n=1 Tax=Labeo rohita TaxID=84645 RepID=A0A498LH65_LABRO|nr:ER membrane complex subunit 7 [Labeo rohita]
MHPVPGNVFCHCISESLIMATGSHVESNAEVHRLKQAQPHDLLKRMVCSGDEKNMREVDYSLKDETDQERFPVGRCVHKYSKAKRAVVSKKKTRHSGVGSRACRRSPTASRTSDMANKENELTCADDVQAILYSDNCGFPVNSTDASKMAGAGSKYSDYFTEALFALSWCFSDAEPGPVAGSLSNGDRFKIEGRAIVPGVKTQDWISTARILVEGEEYVGFLKTDGSFAVNDVPSGSYVVEIVSPSFRFDPVRVDITSKGKMRARLVNYIKTSEVIRQPYPLQIRSSGPHTYFMKRETWGWTDFLMNPMVMMMVLPLLIIVLLPKVVNTNDPEMRKEMEQSMNMLNPNPELPDVSEFMTKLFSKGSTMAEDPYLTRSSSANIIIQIPVNKRFYACSVTDMTKVYNT